MNEKSAAERMQLFIDQQVDFLTHHARAHATIEYRMNALHQPVETVLREESSVSATHAFLAERRS